MSSDVEVTQGDKDAANKAFDIAFKGDTSTIDDDMALLFSKYRIAAERAAAERIKALEHDITRQMNIANEHVNRAERERELIEALDRELASLVRCAEQSPHHTEESRETARIMHRQAMSVFDALAKTGEK